VAAQAIVEPGKPPESEGDGIPERPRRRSFEDDLHPRSIRAAARAASERAAFLAILTLVLRAFCLILGVIFHVLPLAPTAHVKRKGR
jgi:hypothetical protein